MCSTLLYVLKHDYKIDIRLKKRNNKKTITSVDGIPEEFDFAKILRYWKKVIESQQYKSFNCTGTVVGV